jgi:hypothetical protein
MTEMRWDDEQHLYVGADGQVGDAEYTATQRAWGDGQAAGQAFVHRRLAAIGFRLPLDFVDQATADRMVAAASEAYRDAYGGRVPEATSVYFALYFAPHPPAES